MLTPLTQNAIAILTAVGQNRNYYCPAEEYVIPEELNHLFTKLEARGIISREGTAPEFLATSYRLTRPASQITLLDILEATGEHLNCNHPTREEMYQRYRQAANRLGVVNHITRLYLSEIKLSDL